MDEDDKTPLLKANNSGESASSSRSSTVPYHYQNEVTNYQYDAKVRSGPSQASLSSLDSILAIFVVAFDTRSGNVVEWCVPEDTDLDGVEFKAMASGSHTLMKDFVYFRKDTVYGLACFENMPVQSDLERGARMKSVGILSPSYLSLHRHKDFLETQVRHQLEIPGRYEQLNAFYEDNKGVLPSTIPSSSEDCNSNPSNSFSPYDQLVTNMKITHPSGGFSHFLKFFGENIFTIWKFALLQKRILFFSPPPIGVVCFRVYATCCLSHHNIRGLGGIELTPHFYVNVADIETLETEMAFVACTTEKIFEGKKNLYDVYVDNQNVTTHIPVFKELLKVTDADKDWLKRLNNIRTERLYPADNMDEEPCDDERIITDFFTDLNDRLFQTLIDVSLTQDKQLTSEHIRNMGLDPTGDRTFLMELLEHYGIDVVLMVDNPCCPK